MLGHKLVVEGIWYREETLFSHTPTNQAVSEYRTLYNFS
jgi:hypothetical protein